MKERGEMHDTRHIGIVKFDQARRTEGLRHNAIDAATPTPKKYTGKAREKRPDRRTTADTASSAAETDVGVGDR